MSRKEQPIVSGQALPRSTGSRWVRLSQLAMAFAAGAVLSAWATYILTQSAGSQAAGPTRPTAAAPAPAKPQAQPRKAAADKPQQEAVRKPEIDPVAQAERINEINRLNRQRMAGGPAMTPGMPPTPGRTAGRIPGRPGMPEVPAPGHVGGLSE